MDWCSDRAACESNKKVSEFLYKKNTTQFLLSMLKGWGGGVTDVFSTLSDRQNFRTTVEIDSTVNFNLKNSCHLRRVQRTRSVVVQIITLYGGRCSKLER